jgi:hypothetical protein
MVRSNPGLWIHSAAGWRQCLSTFPRWRERASALLMRVKPSNTKKPRIRGKTSAENLRIQRWACSGACQPTTAASIRLQVLAFSHVPSRHRHRNGKTYVPLWSSQRTCSAHSSGVFHRGQSRRSALAGDQLSFFRSRPLLPKHERMVVVVNIVHRFHTHRRLDERVQDSEGRRTLRREIRVPIPIQPPWRRFR